MVPRSRLSRALLLVSCILAFMTGSVLASDSWSITSGDGQRSVKFGFLVQARGESLEAAAGSGTQRELYLRRLRLLAGGTLSPRWRFFIETDSPNLGKGDGRGGKVESDIYVQDLVLTYSRSDALNVDLGMLLVPIAHNGTQSAATLLPTDYGPFSFLASVPTGSRVGRDYGAQVRGLLGGRLEYRWAILQGVRGERSEHEFRYAARLVFHVFEPESGLFYTGTSLGKRRILGFGASLDTQEDYETVALDAFWDQPLANGDAITLQADAFFHDGGRFLESFPKQEARYVEAGYFVSRWKLSLFGTWGERDFHHGDTAGETRFEVGVGWYPAGYSRVFKISYGQIEADGGRARDRFAVQLQIFRF